MVPGDASHPRFLSLRASARPNPLVIELDSDELYDTISTVRAGRERTAALLTEYICINWFTNAGNRRAAKVLAGPNAFAIKLKGENRG